jgi:hypothetical protein
MGNARITGYLFVLRNELAWVGTVNHGGVVGAPLERRVGEGERSEPARKQAATKTLRHKGSGKRQEARRET